MTRLRHAAAPPPKCVCCANTAAREVWDVPLCDECAGAWYVKSPTGVEVGDKYAWDLAVAGQAYRRWTAAWADKRKAEAR